MFKLLLAATLLGVAYSIPIDNGVTGDPEIECGPTSIQVTFNTQNSFSGSVYVKNRFAEDACRTRGDNTRSVGQIELPFDQCGTVRERSLEPKGVFMRQTIVISFHPRFLTKIDRAYTIQCFYMEADKTVSTEIEVSMITTGFQTQVVPMPVCRYEILDAANGGNPVQFAIIGQAVFHKWTCDTDTIDTFCMIVHSCTVDDGQGDNLQLLQDDGCAVDRYLMGNLDYPADLMASKEVHVFKYADRPALFFNCQITITVKEPNGQCERPQCAEPGGQGDGSGARQKRSTPIEALPEAAGTLDVSSNYETLDISAQPQHDLPGYLAHRERALSPFFDRPVVLRNNEGICMSSAGFAGFLVAAVALIGAIVTVTSCLIMRNKH
jgi:hypothetical protein